MFDRKNMSSCPFSQGVAPELVANMKDNPEVMQTILKQHKDKYGTRNYIKEELAIATLK